MGEVTTIGLDVAKSVFQIHGVDAAGTVVVRKRISRAKVLEFFSILPSCLVGIEACPSGHHWSRELRALGHTVRLMPPSYVKAYLKRSKNDANDAAAICEAVTRPSMRFVPTKSEQQQSGLMLHRSRQLLVRQRTMLSNAIRGHWPSLVLSRQRGATAQPSCSRSLLTRRMVGYPRPHGSASMFLLANTPRSQQRSELSRSASMPGIVQAKKVAGSSRFLALVPSSPPPWSQKSVIGRSSRPDEAWRPGSGLFPSSIRPAARNVWVESQSRETGICDGCSSRAPWPLSDMRGSMARGASGLRILWSAGRSRSPPLRLPIRSHAWPGP